LSRNHQIPLLQLDALIPLDIFRLPTYLTSGLRFFPTSTLQNWNLQIKNLTKIDETHDLEAGTLQFETDFDFDNSILQPILNFENSVLNLDKQSFQLGDSPTSKSIALLINEILPLNEKQRLVVERVLSSALA
jgi:hypothetical protein